MISLDNHLANPAILSYKATLDRMAIGWQKMLLNICDLIFIQWSTDFKIIFF